MFLFSPAPHYREPQPNAKGKHSSFPKIRYLRVSSDATGGDRQGSTRAQWNNSGQSNDFSIPQLSHPLQDFLEGGDEDKREI